jgi:16S rRNA (cytosine1402-N4)-methyltransferase
MPAMGSRVATSRGLGLARAWPRARPPAPRRCAVPSARPAAAASAHAFAAASTNAPQADADGAPHVPVLMRQVMECFEGRSVRAYVDGTMGAGGHASAMVRAHPEMRAFVGFDVDPAAHALARPRLEAAARSAGREDGATRLHFQLANFRDMRVELEALQLRGQLDGVLLDLGVSSMHLDTPERGFSFNDDGPLDMRMGPGAALTAEALVNDWPEDEIARVLRDYGEERHWRLLARRICDVRAARPIRTTRELVAAIGRVPGVNKRGRSGNVHPATRAFQGIRIAVNDELGAAEAAIPAAIDCLAPGGRLAIITFHSLEDRIVKNAFRKFAGRVEAPDRPISAWEMPPEPPPKIVKLVTRKPIVADEEEVGENVRSRSAKLRICEKL